MVGTSYIGRRLGRYEISSVIGSGGFATVYRAVDTGLERTVALKVVDPSMHHNPTVAHRFVREGQAVASLDHPAVVPVYDTGETDGVLWLAMRLIGGGSLDDALRAGRRLTPDQVVAIVGRIGGALDHAHAHALVHRDVKPSNILLEDNDPRRAWLVDFGIAASARTVGLYTTGALGTAAYMAPEQSRPGAAGPPADIYSLACVTYEMITGSRPYPGDDYVALLMAHAHQPVPPVGHHGLDTLFTRALAKDPAARPTSGAALAQDLRRALATGVDTTALVPLDSVTSTISSTPTVAEPRHDTLLHPEVHRPPPPIVAPGPPMVAPVQEHRPPPPFSSPAQQAGRARIVAGVLALLVATAATVVALQLSTRSDTREISDSQGITYRVPRDWKVAQESPVAILHDGDDQVVATLENLTTEEGDTAAGRLADLDPSVCNVPPAATQVAGADDAARCDNLDDGDIAVALAATGQGQLWVVTVHDAADPTEATAFLDSITLVQPS